jgi:hypothetical protein
MVRNWLRPLLRRPFRFTARPLRPPGAKPWIETLEGRLLPTNFIAAGNYLAEATPTSVAVGDFNNDGKLDFAVTNAASNTVSVFLNNGDGTFAKSGDFSAGTNPQGIAAGKFYGDGNTDLVVADNQATGAITILKGDGTGHFSVNVCGLAAGSMNPYAVAVADLNNDGKSDIIVANAGDSNGNSSSIGILLGNGDGSFTVKPNVTAGLGVRSVAVGDFNTDGKLDLAAANFNSNTVSVLLGNADGTFKSPVNITVGTGPTSVAVGDFNGDLKQDLAIANAGSNNVSILQGDGKGNFKTLANVTAGTNPTSVAIGDFNNDGKQDLAITNLKDNTLTVTFGTGSGTFGQAITVGTGQAPIVVATGDFNNDAKADLVNADNLGDTATVFLGNGNGTFLTAGTYSTGSIGVQPDGIAVHDINGDGKLDVVTANFASSTLSVFLGNGDGTFQPATIMPANNSPTAVIVGEFDGDSFPDLAVTGLDSAGNGIVSIFKGGANGTFGAPLNISVGKNPSALVAGDLNADGKQDLVVANAKDGTVDVLLGNGDGTFQAAVSYTVGTNPLSVALGSFNGAPDIVTANNGSNSVSVLLNNGNGSFQAAMNITVGNAPTAVVSADFNKDMNPDVAVTGVDTSGNSIVSVLLGNGNGTFQAAINSRTGINPTSLAVTDINGGGSLGDGTPDLVSANAGSFDASVLLGNGDGSFQLPQDYLAGMGPSAVAVGDFNGDSAQDLVVANATSNTISVMLNNPELPVFTVVAPSSTTAGATFSLTVTAIFPSNNATDTKYQGTVHFTSSDPLATLPADYTFKPSDNGVHTFANVVLRTSGPRTITATDTSKGTITGTTNPAIQVNPAAIAQLLVSPPIPPTVTAGVPFTVTVTARDIFGNTVPTYTGTIHFTTSDPNFALLPGDYTFTGAGAGKDNGVHTFTNGVSLRTAGSQTITATDTVTGTITGAGIVQVSPAAANSLTMSAPATATAGVAISVTVTAFDVFNNIATGYTGTVHFTSTDAAATLPPDYTFVAADKGVHTFNVTLGTVGSQTITATDTVTSSLTAQAAVTVSAGIQTGFAVTAPGSTTAGLSFGVTVRAVDAFGNTVTTYGGTVHFSSSDIQASLPMDYTFMGADAGVHTFSGVVLRTSGTQTVDATDTVNSSLSGTADVPVAAAAATALTIDAPASATAGAAFTVTVTARDPFQNVATSYAGTVHFSSSDAQALLPADYTFVPADQGVHSFMVILDTAGSQSITANDAVNGFTISALIAVSPTLANHLGVSAPASATAGSPFSFTVTALDPFNNVATGYGGTVHFSSSDTQSVLPADFTFGVADQGVHTFTGTLGTGGNQTLTVTDTTAASINGTAVVLVTSGAATHLAIGAPGTATAGEAFSMTVTALDAFGNIATGYGGTVHFSSSDGAGVLPSDYTFVPGDSGVHSFNVTLKTSGSQTLTATDTVTASITGSAGLTVAAGVATHLGVSIPAAVTSGSGFVTTITALDDFGNRATSYAGTIHFTSSDPAAVLPADFVFAPGDAGAHTFLLTLHTPVFQTVSAADTTTSSISGTATTRVVTAYLAVGADAGGGPEVRVFDAVTGKVVFDFFAYDPRFLGGVRVAVGDVNGDGIPDIITAPGPGGGPDIRVFDGQTGQLIREFMAYNPAFLGGVFVAAGDVNGDGFADIVTGADFGGGPHVQAFSGKDGSVLQSFMAYDPRFLGGVRVAVGDVNGDGRADIITAPGAPGGPDIRIFDGGTGNLIQEYLAYDAGFLGGVYVAAGDINGDGKADVITGTGAQVGQAANVRAFSGATGALLENFFAYVSGFTGGVRVGYVPDINGDGLGDIVTGAGPSGGPQVEAFDGASTAVLDSFYAFDPRFLGGVFVGG